jgi:hypothetical protein
VDYIGLVKTSAGPAPSGMTIVSGPYTMVPQNITFLPLATLVFSVPPGVNVQELILMEEQDGAWTDTTFSVADNKGTASINRAGTFALFAPVHPAGTTTEVIPESTYIPPTSMTTTQPTPTKAGLEFSIIAGGFLGLMIIGTRRKHP